jgi:hypothetical protein
MKKRKTYTNSKDLLKDMKKGKLKKGETINLDERKELPNPDLIKFPDPFGYRLFYARSPFTPKKQVYLEFPSPIEIPFDFFEDLVKSIRKEAKALKKGQETLGITLVIPKDFSKLIKKSKINGTATKTKDDSNKKT